MISRKMRVKDLVKTLKDEIAFSRLPSDSPIMSARELSEKYGTSTLTANRVLKILSNEGLLYRIRGSGSFVSKTGENAKKLRIGIAFPIPTGDRESLDAAFNIYPRQLSENLRNLGHEIFNLSYYDMLSEAYVKEYIGRLDGIILSHGCLDNKTFPLLEKTCSNIITVQNEKISNYSCHQVVPDLRTGFKKALLHLLEKDCPQIYIATCNPEEHHKYRIEIIFQIAEELNIPSEKIELVTAKRQLGDLGRMSGQEMGRELIKKQKPLAVFSLSDFTSFGIIDVALEKKLRFGTDISLASYDDLEGYGLLPFITPFVSSVTNPKERICAEAVKILLAHHEKNDHLTHIVKVPTEFIQRKSSTGKD